MHFNKNPSTHDKMKRFEREKEKKKRTHSLEWTNGFSIDVRRGKRSARCMISLTMTMRVVRLVAMVGYRRTVKPGNKSMQPTGLHSACLSAWWRQADLSVSTNTPYSSPLHIGLSCSTGLVCARRKVQTCSRNHVFLYIAFTRRASNVRSSHVCVRLERIEYDVPRDRKQSPLGLRIPRTSFFSIQARSINYLLYTHCFVHTGDYFRVRFHGIPHPRISIVFSLIFFSS